MPAIRSRMSSSSSTINISDAVSGKPALLIPDTLVFRRLLAQREGERHLRALPSVGPVLQRDSAAVVFHDLAHDGEAEPRSLRARGDIGLGQPVAVFRRKPYAVVADAVDEFLVRRFGRDRDGARRVVALLDARGDALA